VKTNKEFPHRNWFLLYKEIKIVINGILSYTTLMN